MKSLISYIPKRQRRDAISGSSIHVNRANVAGHSSAKCMGLKRTEGSLIVCGSLVPHSRSQHTPTESAQLQDPGEISAQKSGSGIRCGSSVNSMPSPGQPRSSTRSLGCERQPGQGPPGPKGM